MFISFISIVLKHVQGDQESGDPEEGKYVAEAQYRAKVAVNGDIGRFSRSSQRTTCYLRGQRNSRRLAVGQDKVSA